MSTEQSRKIILPTPIEAYFKADNGDSAAVARCFTENAIVTDEKQSHAGRDAIRRWKESKGTEYSYVSVPFAIQEYDGRTVVTSHVTGNFPGNEIDLRYMFKLEGDKIAQLEIVV